MSWYYLATVFSCVMVSAQVILLASVMAINLVKVLACVMVLAYVTALVLVMMSAPSMV